MTTINNAELVSTRGRIAASAYEEALPHKQIEEGDTYVSKFPTHIVNPGTNIRS